MLVERVDLTVQLLISECERLHLWRLLRWLLMWGLKADTMLTRTGSAQPRSATIALEFWKFARSPKLCLQTLDQCCLQGTGAMSAPWQGPMFEVDLTAPANVSDWQGIAAEPTLPVNASALSQQICGFQISGCQIC